MVEDHGPPVKFTPFPTQVAKQYIEVDLGLLATLEPSVLKWAMVVVLASELRQLDKAVTMEKRSEKVRPFHFQQIPCDVV